MDKMYLKQQIKGIREKSSLIIFLIGFLAIIVLALNLFLSTSFNKRTGGIITQEAASDERIANIDAEIGVDQVINTPKDSVEKSVGLKTVKTADLEGDLGEIHIYFTQEGDSTWKIAEELLGDGNRYPEIEKTNELMHNQRLEVGQIILIDVSAKNNLVFDESSVTLEFGDYEERNQIRENGNYVVQKGDSLWKIAQKVYSNPILWPKIYEVNKELIGSDPNLIYSEIELKIPKI